MESKLIKILNILKNKKIEKTNYVIPNLWYLNKYHINHKDLPNGEVLVNPYELYSAVIEEYILPNKVENIDYSLSLSKAINEEDNNGNWLKKASLYSMMIRTSTSYDNDRSYSLDLKNIDGLKETGTFVKTLALLPLLKRLGVNVLYLLPISLYSLKDKKGELGSPYAVESFTKLDPLLKDDMTGDSSTISEEFSALVEACHIMGIRVTIDIIPRTNSVNSELIKEHPEWFYWIKASEAKDYRVPFVENVPNTTYPSFDHMEEVYKSADVLRHIKMFMMNPRDTDPTKWASIKGKTMEEFLANVEKEFDLTVAPAFSDNINDIQPAWTDVTYFRLYNDDPLETKHLLNIEHNPYILFDTIKSNLYPGKEPNLKLWHELSSIIPFYMNEFGIDGARIDMGHALPKDLLKMIMDRAKSIDNNFGFIAEELNMDNDKVAKDNHYNAMIGNGFWALSRINEGEFHKFISKAHEKAIPVFACAETHDSKRAAMRYGANKYSRFITILNYFIPNTLPFINSGQEFYEKEPMNTGVDADQTDLNSLDKEDIFYGKLALFDKYALHYANPQNKEIIDHLVDVLKTREKWLDTMIDPFSFTQIHFYEDKKSLIGLSYYNKDNNKALIILANADMNNGTSINASLEELREKMKSSSSKARLVYATYEMPRDFYDFTINGDLYCYMGSGEIKILEL